MNRSIPIPLAMLLSGVSSFSLAEPFDLGTQVVTASRTAQTAEQTLASISVIDRQTIEQVQPTSVNELLRRVQGISITNNGGPGKASSIFMRGTDSDHVLLMIDGIKIGSVTSGGAALQDIPVELIERIEVVRGPRSSLYGSEAIGGVIQIFTRRGSGQGLKPFFSLGYGTHHTLNASAGISGGNGPGWFSLAVNSQDTDGINATRWGNSSYEPDRDGYRNLSGSLRGGYRFNNGLEIDGTLMRTRAHNDFDQVYAGTGYSANADNKQNLMGGRLRYSPWDFWRITLQAGRSEDKSTNEVDHRFYSRFDSQRDTASWQNDFILGEGHELTLGIDWQKDEVSGSTDYLEDSRDNKGWYAQYLGEAGRHNWQLSLRRDDNEQFGNHDTGNIAWGFALTDEVRFGLSYGTAFKAPTFNELYFPGYGNADLDAEKSKSFEADLTGHHAWGHWGISLYHTRIDDLIAYDATLGMWGAPNNIDKARIRGLELNIGGQWQGWDWQANATFLDPENRSSDGMHGNTLPRRAKRLFNMDVDRRFDRFSVGASVHAEGHRYDDLANRTRLGGYATVDLRAEYALTPEWRLQGRVANLFGADYETAWGYNQPGQTVLLTVRYQAL